MQEYTEKEIELFLQLYEESMSDDQTQSLKKLISVQDKIASFKDIDHQELKAVVYDLKFVRFSYKDYVIKEGDESSEIFYIIDGECQVFIDKHKVGKLKAGDVFGEVAAIFHTPRNASVVCAAPTATMLSFSIDHDNMEFCASALAQLYKNLAFEINSKLESLNKEFSKKR